MEGDEADPTDIAPDFVLVGFCRGLKGLKGVLFFFVVGRGRGVGFWLECCVFWGRGVHFEGFEMDGG